MHYTVYMYSPCTLSPIEMAVVININMFSAISAYL